MISYNIVFLCLTSRNMTISVCVEYYSAIKKNEIMPFPSLFFDQGASVTGISSP